MRYNLFWVSFTCNIWSLFYIYQYVKIKIKRGNAVWYNNLFHCMYVPWTTFLRLLICLNENKRGSGVWYHISSYCKYSEENCSSRGKLTWRFQVRCCSICRITGLASSRPRMSTLPRRTYEIQTTEDAILKFAYLVLRNTRRPTSPDYLPNLHGTLDRNGNADSNRSAGKKCSWDKLFQVISVEKRLLIQ